MDKEHTPTTPNHGVIVDTGQPWLILYVIMVLVDIYVDIASPFAIMRLMASRMIDHATGCETRDGSMRPLVVGSPWQMVIVLL